MSKTVSARVQSPFVTTAVWERKNPVLLNGETGYELTASGAVLAKTGDGVTAWSGLPYTGTPTAATANHYVDVYNETTGDYDMPIPAVSV